MIVSSGAFIAVATAVVLQQHRTRRLLGVGSWSVAALLLAISLAFVLDAVQAGAGIRSDMVVSYRLASITAGVKLVVGMLSFAFVARGCRVPPRARRGAIASPPLVMAKHE